MKRPPSVRCLAEFRRLVYEHYLRLGRHDLPWRMTRNPHRILVAEVMLRQTRVQRVLAKYEPFLDRFPDIASLSKAPLQGLLRSWSGLGYDRRALRLRRAERKTVERFGGGLPKDFDALVTPPGVGRAAAGAVCAFAFGEAHPFIETNNRTVFLHHFFPAEARAAGLERERLERNLERLEKEGFVEREGGRRRIAR